MTGAWERCATHLAVALEHAGDTHSLDDVARMVREGEAQFWPGRASGMVTILEDDPAERRLLIWLAGGELRELVEELRPAAEAWARGQGCRRVMIIGRPGWERALAPKGYAPLARLIAKEL